MHGAKTEVSDGLMPDSRKKLSSAGGTNAPEGPTLHVFMLSGLLNKGCELATAQELARSQFSISALGLVGLALIGRFKWCPPVKLYARLKAKSCPRSRSTERPPCWAYPYWKLAALGNPNGCEMSGTPAARYAWLLKSEGALGAGLN